MPLAALVEAGWSQGGGPGAGGAGPGHGGLLLWHPLSASVGRLFKGLFN